MSKQHFANGVIGASLLDAFEQCQSRTRITNADDDEVYTSRPQITLAFIRPKGGQPLAIFTSPTSAIGSCRFSDRDQRSERQVVSVQTRKGGIAPRQEDQRHERQRRRQQRQPAQTLRVTGKNTGSPVRRFRKQRSDDAYENGTRQDRDPCPELD